MSAVGDARKRQAISVHRVIEASMPPRPVPDFSMLPGNARTTGEIARVVAALRMTDYPNDVYRAGYTDALADLLDRLEIDS